MYQQIAGTWYQRPASETRFTFLTLPGVMGVLSYSGSAALTAVGMFLITLFVIGTERLLAVASQSAFFAAVGGVGLANVFAQMGFPYLTLVFIGQLLFAAAAVALLLRFGRRSAAIRN
jgi:hypothetical protein